MVKTFPVAAGGFVMKVDSRVQLTHEPTKETVECGEHRSMHANRNAAWESLLQILKSRPDYKRSMDEEPQGHEPAGTVNQGGFPSRISFHENGEANSYYLADAQGGKWLLALLVNGEVMPTRQVEFLKHIVECWNAREALDLEVLETTKAQRNALLVQLERAVKFYETRGLVAEVSGCGAWVNDSRDAIAACKTRPVEAF